MGWFANILLCYQWWALGHKRRHAMLVGAVAGFIWAGIAYARDMNDLLFIEVLLSSLQLRAWILWGKDERNVSTGCAVHSRADSDQ